MKKLRFLSLALSAVVALTTLFTSCDPEEKLVDTTLEVTPDELKFNADGTPVAGSTIQIESNSDWIIEAEGAASNQVSLSRESGNGNATITVAVAAGGEATFEYNVRVINPVGDDDDDEDFKIIREKAGNTITIPNLIAMEDGAKVSTEQDMVLTAVITGDPTGGNFSKGTLYLMTEGATTAGNGIVIYNNSSDLITTDFAMGDKVEVTLKKDEAEIDVYQDTKQIKNVKGSDIKKLGTVEVTPIVITVDKLKEFVAMPVTIENATSTKSDVWRSDANGGDHTFNVSGAEFAIRINSGAVFTDGVYKATTGTISGMATIYSGNAQLSPRNLDDVAAFVSSEPTISAVNPTAVTFEAAGGEVEVELSVANQGENAISVSGLSGILSATVSGTTVTVKATENAGEEVSQTLTVAIANGNSIEVPVKVLKKSDVETLVSSYVAADDANFEYAVAVKDTTLAGGILIDYEKASSSNEAKYYYRVFSTEEDPEVRIYNNSNLIISCGEDATIVKIEFVTRDFKINAMDGLADKIWTGSAQEVTFVPNGTTQIQQIKVSYVKK